MTLTDNSNPEVWKVRTLSFDESDVPSVICLIPGPDADAVHLANKCVQFSKNKELIILIQCIINLWLAGTMKTLIKSILRQQLAIRCSVFNSS